MSQSGAEASGAFVVGVDVGGTHATAAVVDAARERIIEPSRERVDVDCHASPSTILHAWADLIRRSTCTAGVNNIAGIGLAMPGPFDYSRGIGAFRGVPKFERLFGVNVRQGLRDRLDLPAGTRIVFRNDAICFALGEAWLGAGRGAQRLIAITLGTGLGSAFVRDGAAVTHGDKIPPSGWLYDVPHEGTIAEEHFSSRGLIRAFEEALGQTVESVAHIAQLARRDATVRHVFDDFGRRLGAFLLPWLRRFDAQRLVVGGSITGAWDLFGDALARACEDVEACPASLFENAALVGAARVARDDEPRLIDESRLIRENRFRRTGQKLMPLRKPPVAAGQYDLYPAHELPTGRVESGFDSLANELAGHKRVAIDGYTGVFYDDFRARLGAALRARGIRPIWYEARVALKPELQINGTIEPFLGGDDPLFGTRFTGTLSDFFDTDALASFAPDDGAEMCILIGPGAALAKWDGPLVYADLPKNELQFRARAGSVTNLGADEPRSPKEMYKRFYFVDWVALNEHKRALLPRVNYAVDAQRPHEPAWTRGDDLRAGLSRLATNAFRVRPWFEPGPWGGQWMKENFTDLPSGEPNYAWSFELIAPENGLIFTQGGNMLEVSFDWLMVAHAERVIGESTSFFGTEFPIRFDYLDTVRGGNLSVQCHPRPAYIRSNFGERFTQDETYYIHHADPDARVYLGFKDDIDPDEFRAALERSADEGAAVDIDRFVASWPAKKHDLFLIPNGTIHCSGIGNLVLEISATPYIFTFKMYDWMRMDLDGRPRSLNIGRAFDNLYFDRKGERVARELTSRPREAASGSGWSIVHLPTHEEHFYDVRRLEFSEHIEVKTEGSCHVGNLVEGGEITVHTADSRVRVAYGETFVVSADARTYRLVNEGSGEPKVVIAYVKSGYSFR